MSKKITKTFPKRLKEERESKGLSMSGLCQMAGINRPNYHKIENGNVSPTIRTVEKIASVLGVPVEKLMQ